MCLLLPIIVLFYACSPQADEQDCFSQQTTDSLMVQLREDSAMGQWQRINRQHYDSLETYGCVDRDSMGGYSWVAAGRWKDLFEVISDTLPQAKNIVFSKQTQFPVDRTPGEIIHRLFPGRLYKGTTSDGDTVMANLWVCSSCPPDTLGYFGSGPDEWSRIFPDAEMNNTSIDTVIQRFYNRQRYSFISFYHLHEASPTGGGRFTGAPTGMAILRHTDHAQELVAFHPCLGTYGSFQNPVIPVINITGKHIFVSYEFPNGGPGEVYTAYRETFVLNNGRLQLAAKYDYLAMFNTYVSRWFSNISFTPDDHCQITVTGVINGFLIDKYYTFLGENAPGKMREWLKQHAQDNSCYRFTFLVEQELKNSLLVTLKEDWSAVPMEK